MKYEVIKDAIDLLAATMTILGVSGIVTWGIFENSRNLYASRILTIFSYSIKTALSLLLVIPAYAVWALVYEFCFQAFNHGTFSYIKYYWDSDDPAGYVVPHAIAFLLIVPLYLVLAASIYCSSFEPVRRLLRTLFRMAPTKIDQLAVRPSKPP